MKKYIIIKADENDGDYLTSRNLVTDEELITIFHPVIEVLKNLKESRKASGTWITGYNWETEECKNENSPEKLYINTGLLTKEQVNRFTEFVPYTEYGIHTIISIEVIEVVYETKLF